MKKDWMFVVNNNICDVRTVGVLVRDGKILEQRDCGGNDNRSFSRQISKRQRSSSLNIKHRKG